MKSIGWYIVLMIAKLILFNAEAIIKIYPKSSIVL